MTAALVTLARSRRRRVRTGQACDPAAFAATCRVPLFSNAWNRWRLFRSTRDDPSDEQIAETAKALVGRVFAHNAAVPLPTMADESVRADEPPLAPDRPSGVATNLIVEIGPRTAAGQTPESLPGAFGSSRKIASRLECNPTPSLVSGDYVPVGVRFVYRGTAKSAPWPARRAGSTLEDAEWCPEGADWILDAAFAPVADDEVPAPGAGGEEIPSLPGGVDVPGIDWPDLPDFPDPADIGKGIAMATWPLLLGLGAVAVIVASD